MAPSGFLPFVPSRTRFLALVAQTGLTRFLVLLSLASFMLAAIFSLWPDRGSGQRRNRPEAPGKPPIS